MKDKHTGKDIVSPLDRLNEQEPLSGEVEVRSYLRLFSPFTLFLKLHHDFKESKMFCLKCRSNFASAIEQAFKYATTIVFGKSF